MNWWKKVAYSISWVPMIIIKIILIVIGWIILPFILPFYSKGELEYPERHFPKWLSLWDNTEGMPKWWLSLAEEKNWFIKTFPAYWWFGFRNPVNGLRWLFNEPEEVNFSGSWPYHNMEAQDMLDEGVVEADRWAYSGWFAGYRKININTETFDHYTEFWIGWKVGSTVPGMGFTIQYRKDIEVGR